MDKDYEYRYATLDGAAFAHIAQFHEQCRLARRMAQCQKAAGVR